MCNKRLINYQQSLLIECDKLINLYKIYEDNQSKINAMEEYMQSYVIEKIKDLNPKIMFYGIYNAGKSTLLNAMMGEEVAEMADRPKTDVITPYEWNGYTLMDAPGIDAPIQHEIISKENLKKCELVLFIMSTNGTYDTEKNYKEMLQIINNDKRLIIVLNNKNGYDSNDPNIIKIKQKVIENLVNYSGDRSIGDKYAVLVLNAKSALKGRKENKEKLIERSRIIEFEKVLFRNLKEVKAYDVLKTPLSNVNNTINELKEMISGNIDNQDEKVMIETINKLEDYKLQALNEIRIKIKRLLIANEESLIVNLIKNQDNNNLFSDIESGYEGILQESIKNIQYKLEKEIKIELLDNMHLEDNIVVINKEIQGLQNEYGKELFDGKSKSDSSIEEIEIEGQVNILDGVASKAALGMAISPEVITIGLKILSDILKSNQKKEEEEYRRMLLEVQQANAEAIKEVERQALIRQEARGIAKSYMYDLENDLMRHMKSVVEDYVNRIKDVYMTHYDEKKEDSKYHMNNLEQLSSIKNNFSNIVRELNL